jgi:glycosyltransferase involved in cell wall biosynthesis
LVGEANVVALVSGAHVLILLENEPYPYDRRVSQEARALTDAGFRVTVAAPTGGGSTEPDEDDNGVRVLRFRAPPEGSGPRAYVREYAAALRGLGGIARRLEREDPPDIVMACNPPDFLLAVAEPARHRGARLVFDHHDLSPELFEEKFGRRGTFHRLLLAAERYAFCRADVVLSTNDSYGEIARGRGGVAPGRVFVVRNGPDPGRIHPVPPRPELLRGRAHLVLWLGRMSTQENLDQLVDVAAILAQRGRDDIAFAAVGPGDARNALLADVRARGLDDRFELPGRVDDDLVRAYLSTADVCVSLERSSPMNDRSTMIKVLEYMAAGRPVVQSPLAEMQRICGDATAWASGAASMADEIAGLLDNPGEARRLGAAARARIEGGLLWPDQAPRLVEAMHTALASPRIPRRQRRG